MTLGLFQNAIRFELEKKTVLGLCRVGKNFVGKIFLMDVRKFPSAKKNIKIFQIC